MTMKSSDCYFLLEMRNSFRGKVDWLMLPSEHLQTPLYIEGNQKKRTTPSHSHSTCLLFFIPALLIWEFPSSLSESLCSLQICKVIWAEKCTQAQIVHFGTARPCPLCMRRQKKNIKEFGELEGKGAVIQTQGHLTVKQGFHLILRNGCGQIFSFNRHHPIQIRWWPVVNSRWWAIFLGDFIKLGHGALMDLQQKTHCEPIFGNSLK